MANINDIIFTKSEQEHMTTTLRYPKHPLVPSNLDSLNLYDPPYPSNKVNIVDVTVFVRANRSIVVAQGCYTGAPGEEVAW